MSALVRHYRWTHDFWRSMGYREFYGWVDQANRENGQERAPVDSWSGADAEEWWQSARSKREQQMGR